MSDAAACLSKLIEKTQRCDAGRVWEGDQVIETCRNSPNCAGTCNRDTKVGSCLFRN